VFEEELVISKRMVVRERIVIRKETTTRRSVEATLRRERVEVEGDPGLLEVGLDDAGARME
jgi:stress response protein YsnF